MAEVAARRKGTAGTNPAKPLIFQRFGGPVPKFPKFHEIRRVKTGDRLAFRVAPGGGFVVRFNRPQISAR